MFSRPFLLLCVFFCVLSNQIFAQIYINEVSASNESVLEDGEGEYPDWIELYNVAGSTIDLNGYGISDDKSRPFKYTFPEFQISSGSYGLLFASDKDTIDNEGFLHVNFKLSADGETLYLTSPSGSLIDSLSFPLLLTDESYGRSGTDFDQQLIFVSPTPLSANSTSGYTARSPKPEVSKAGGFYTRSVSMSILNQDLAHTTYFTTDGTDPTQDSEIFGTGSRTFNETTVLKLRTIEPGNLPSKVEVNTYFVLPKHSIPVISLVTDPEYFFDNETGIYVMGPDAEPNPPHHGANFWKDIEVPAHTEFFTPNGELGFKSHVGVKIYGAYSRSFKQKSLAIFFRGKYGLSELEYPLFEEKDIDVFQSFLLRNAGNDFGAAHLRDAAMTTIIQDVMDLDYQAYQPSVVYLNGEYWGIHNIREKISEHFIASNHNIDPDNVDLIEFAEHPEAKNGSIELYLDFMADLEAADMSNPDDYQAVLTHIDLDNFIYYMATEIFYANTDWPATNVKLWRDRTPGGKWRWILYDTDHGFNLYSGEGDFNLDMFEHTLQTNPDLLKYSNPLWATFTFRKLMENDDFKTSFLLRLNELMNTVFTTDRMIGIIDSLAAGIETEMPQHEERWDLASWTSEGPFKNQIEDMRDFARKRPDYMYQHMQAHFGLTDLDDISIDLNNVDFGKVLVNRSYPNRYPWHGRFFSDFSVPVTAVPKPGYRFIKWSGDVNSTDPTIHIHAGDSVFAHFEPSTSEVSQIVINEIMYNAAEDADPEDWVELYNPSETAIDISNWVLKDEDNDHRYTFPAGTNISPKGYITAVQNTEAFSLLYSVSSPIYGDLGFGLSGGSDQVRLYDAKGALVDSVSYDDEAPWPEQADGTGFSLELKHPNLDNSLPENWEVSSTLGGTPNAKNSVQVSNESFPDRLTEFQLHQNFPNPFNPSTVIRFSIPKSQLVTLQIFDPLGRLVSELVHSYLPAGDHEIAFNALNLASGVYIYQLKAGDYIQTKKMLLLK